MERKLVLDVSTKETNKTSVKSIAYDQAAGAFQKSNPPVSYSEPEPESEQKKITRPEPTVEKKLERRNTEKESRFNPFQILLIYLRHLERTIITFGRVVKTS